MSDRRSRRSKWSNLNDLADQAEQMKGAAKNFAKNAAQLNKKMQEENSNSLTERIWGWFTNPKKDTQGGTKKNNPDDWDNKRIEDLAGKSQAFARTRKLSKEEEKPSHKEEGGKYFKIAVACIAIASELLLFSKLINSNGVKNKVTTIAFMALAACVFAVIFSFEKEICKFTKKTLRLDSAQEDHQKSDTQSKRSD